MKGAAKLLLSAAVAALLVVACGNSSPAVPEDASNTPSAGAVDGTPTLTPRSETGGLGQVMRPSTPGEVVAGIIDSCTWEPPESGGPVELNLSFTIVNNSKKSVWTTFRVQDSSGTMYRPGGTASEVTVNVGEMGSRTIHTDKFPVGAEDLQLIISARQLGERHRRVKETVPLGQCAQP